MLFRSVKWAATNLPPGGRIVADRVPADLLSGEARLWTVFGPQNGVDWASIYFSPEWSSYQTNVLRQVQISYIYVDERLSESLPNEGYYIYQGETQNPTRLTEKDLSKFASVPGIKAIYHRGPISIYSTAGLGVPTTLSGYSGDRRLGFGVPGDAIFGVAVVLVLYGLRRRLRWAVDVLRDAWLVGGIATLAASLIFIGFIMFGLNIAPGIGFTVGAALSGVVVLAVSRYRHGMPIMSLGGGRVTFNPLIALAVVIAVLAISISLRSAWVLDVSDVNNILHGVQ